MAFLSNQRGCEKIFTEFRKIIFLKDDSYETRLQLRVPADWYKANIFTAERLFWKQNTPKNVRILVSLMTI